MQSLKQGKSESKIGVLLVGALGMTGTAVLAGICGMKKGVIQEGYGTTSHPSFSGVHFIPANLMEVGGSDYQLCSISQRVREYGHLPDDLASSVRDNEVSLFPGLWTRLEYPLTEEQGFVRYPASLAQGAEMVTRDIESFRSQTGCDRVVVVFVGTPARDPEISPDRFRLADPYDGVLPSGLMYAIGAVNANAHFIDFTPSRTLEFVDLWRHAESCGVQLAGRDGSTGQTMLKITIAEMLARRGIQIDAWYSTNLIGNRDGLVLSEADYAAP
jgi:myo-inositol-1-phosphate synthase